MGKVHRSKSKGVEGGKGGPKPGSRFERHPGGCVPQSDRSPQEQLDFLDSRGFTAAKERLKLKRRLVKLEKKAKVSSETIKPNPKIVEERLKRGCVIGNKNKKTGA